MSTSQGDGGTFSAFNAEDLSRKTWADLMQEEQEEKMLRGLSVEKRESPPPARVSTRVPPFTVIVSNLPNSVSDEDIFFYFGGESVVKDMKVRNEHTAWIEFVDEAAMEKALEKDDLFNGQKVNVEEEVHRPSSDVRKIEGKPPASYHNREHNRDSRDSRESYQRQNYRQDSRSDDRGGYNRYNPQSVHQQHQFGQYNTYGGSRGAFRGGRGDRRGRGYGDDHRHPHGYGGYHSGSDRDRTGGPIMRSGSYTNQGDGPRPSSINTRSRTESSSSSQYDRRPPSATGISSHPVVAVTKPSSKDIFGDAKPVDTASKLLQAEEKLNAAERERKAKEVEDKERKKVEEEKKRMEEETKKKEEKAMNQSIQPPTEVKVQILKRIPDSSRNENIENGPHDNVTQTTRVSKSEDTVSEGHPRLEGVQSQENVMGDKRRGRGGRTFSSRTLQKSATASDVTSDARGRGRGRGSRGHYRGNRGGGGGGGYERRGSVTVSEKSHYTENERTEGSEKEKKIVKEEKKDERKEIIHERRSAPPSSTVVKKENEVKEKSGETENADGDRKKNKKKNGDESESTLEKKDSSAKPPTPRKKKTTAKGRFASNNKFDALEEAGEV